MRRRLWSPAWNHWRRRVSQVGGGFDDGRAVFLAELETVEGEHLPEGVEQRGAQAGIGAEGADGRVVERGRGGVELAALAGGEKPLDVIVDALQPVGVPGAQVAQPAALGVGGLAEIEGDERVCHGEGGRRKAEGGRRKAEGGRRKGEKREMDS